MSEIFKTASPVAQPQMAVKKAAPSEAELADMGRKFEAAFLTPMFDEMLKTAGKASFGAGNAEEMWRSFMAGAIADEVAQTGSTGIAEIVTAQMRAQAKAYGG